MKSRDVLAELLYENECILQHMLSDGMDYTDQYINLIKATEKAKIEMDKEKTDVAV